MAATMRIKRAAIPASGPRLLLPLLTWCYRNVILLLDESLWFALGRNLFPLAARRHGQNYVSLMLYWLVGLKKQCNPREWRIASKSSTDH
jgi:hypothetical protein